MLISTELWLSDCSFLKPPPTEESNAPRTCLTESRSPLSAIAWPQVYPAAIEWTPSSPKVTRRLGRAQQVMYADGRHSVLIVLQGRDASGKDGVMRTVVGAANPAGVRVHSFKVPTPIELAHDYLWRIHNVAPEKGIDPESSTARITKTCSSCACTGSCPKPYGRSATSRSTISNDAYRERRRHLQVLSSRVARTKRLIERVEDETKNWKFNAGDLEERNLWTTYTAYDDALRKCSTEWAPWYVVPVGQEQGGII